MVCPLDGTAGAITCDVEVAGALQVLIVHAAPDLVLGLVGEVAHTVVTQLAVVAAAVARAHIVADVSAIVGPTAPARVFVLVLDEGSVAWVIAARVALVAIVRPENGGADVPAVGAAAPVLAAGIACGAEVGCHVGAVGLVAEVDVGRHGGVGVGGGRHVEGGLLPVSW